jgi:tRNA threonylcarbamoyladenosine biosynthesis protein TsaB
MILAIETTGTDCSLALTNGGILLAERSFNHQMRLVELLQTHILEVLKSAQVALSDLDAISVSAGPGSFTGLRVGVTTAKTLGYALDLPVVPIPTLQVIAEQSLPADKIAVMMRARPGSVYFQLFEGSNGVTTSLGSAEVVSVEDVIERLSSVGEPITLCGDALTKEGAHLLAELTASGIQVTQAMDAPPHAHTVAAIAQRMLAISTEYSALELEPIYLAQPAIGPKKQRPTAGANSSALVQ